jgi:hypothetical protein
MLRCVETTVLDKPSVPMKQSQWHWQGDCNGIGKVTAMALAS